MKCHLFDRELPDWIAGRLDERMAAEMRVHAESCASCRALAESERALRTVFAVVPAPSREPDIRMALAGRLAALEPKKVRSARLSLSRLRWAAVPLAAGALCALAFVNQGGSHSDGAQSPAAVGARTEQTRDDLRMVNLVADMRESADPDSEYTIDRTHHVPMLQRAVLVGGGRR